MATSWLVAVGLVALALTPAAGGQEPEVHDCSAEVKKALTQVIDAQLTAFRAGDFTTAYRFASGEIQALYPAAAFEQMVKSAYPLVASSSAAEYRSAVDNGEEAVVEVHLTAGSRVGDFRYRLHKEEAGWRITGVFEVKPIGISV